MKALKVFGLMVLMTILFSRHSSAQINSNVIHKTTLDTSKSKSKPVQKPNKKKKSNPVDSPYKAREDRTKQPPLDTITNHTPK